MRGDIAYDMSTPRHEALGLTPADLYEMFRTMLIARAFDERTWILVRQGRIPFTVGGHGHEGAQVAAAKTLVPGRDWVLPYYRDLGVVLTLGMTVEEAMLSEFSKAADPNSGGRQMPKHWSCRRLRIVTQSSVLATHLPHACGLAWAMRLKGEEGIVWASFGEGSTSKGDFHEALNFAGIHKLPVVFFCENNLYAISVPFERQSSVPRVSDRAAAYGIRGVSVDGNDVFEVYEASKEAASRALAGEGPTLIEARTYRYNPHTSNDDDRRYRNPEEVEEWKRVDPIPRFAAYMKEHGLLTDDEEQAAREEAERRVREAVKAAEASPDPDPASYVLHVYGNGGVPGGR